MKQPDIKTFSTEMLQYFLEKHGKAPMYWNFTRNELEDELKRRGITYKSCPSN